MVAVETVCNRSIIALIQAYETVFSLGITPAAHRAEFIRPASWCARAIRV